MLTTSYGYIKSHGKYGSQSYKNNKDCSWNIAAPSGKRVRLEFVGEIEIEDHNKLVVVFPSFSSSKMHYGLFSLSPYIHLAVTMTI